jgi:histone-lysine N-methyltransferase SETD3
MLFSRLVRLRGRGDALALVPWADFVNHAPSATAHLDWEEGASGGDSGCVVLRTERPYAAGEEIFASYGQRASGDLLLSYGFALEDNPHETVALRLEVPRSNDNDNDNDDDAMWAMKADALARHARLPAETFPLRAGGGTTPDMLPWAAFAAARVGDAAACAALADATFAAQTTVAGGGWRLFGGGRGGVDARAAAAPRVVGGAAAEAAAREFVLAAVRRSLAALDAADTAAAAAAKPPPPPRAQPAKRARRPSGGGGGAAAAAAPREGSSSSSGAAARVMAAAASIRGVERRILQRTEFVLRAELRQLAGK